MGSTIIVPPSAICCSICWEIPNRNTAGAEEAGVDQGRLSAALATHQPVGERRHRGSPDDEQGADCLAALLPHEDAEHDPAHAHHRERGTDEVDAARPRVGDVAHEPDVDEHHQR